MTMPGRNGIELLRDIVARYPDTAVLMVSEVDRPQRVRDPSGVEFDPKVVQTFAQTELAELPNSHSIKVNESTPDLEFSTT